MELTYAVDLSHQKNHHQSCPGKDNEIREKGVFLI